MRKKTIKKEDEKRDQILKLRGGTKEMETELRKSKEREKKKKNWRWKDEPSDRISLATRRKGEGNAITKVELNNLVNGEYYNGDTVYGEIDNNINDNYGDGNARGNCEEAGQPKNTQVTSNMRLITTIPKIGIQQIGMRQLDDHKFIAHRMTTPKAGLHSTCLQTACFACFFPHFQ